MDVANVQHKTDTDLVFSCCALSRQSCKKISKFIHMNIALYARGCFVKQATAPKKGVSSLFFAKWKKGLLNRRKKTQKKIRENLFSFGGNLLHVVCRVCALLTFILFLFLYHFSFLHNIYCTYHEATNKQTHKNV